MKILSPSEITEAAANAGAAKARLTSSSTTRLLLSACLAGAYISLGGILSMTLGFGFPELTASNPALQRLLSGAAFPIGLILVVVLGAELFTGNNAVLIPSMLQRRHGPGLTLRNWSLVYLGNLIGALAFTYFMVYRCGLTAVDPWHSAAVKVAEAKVSMPWDVVFLKGIDFPCLEIDYSQAILILIYFACYFVETIFAEKTSHLLHVQLLVFVEEHRCRGVTTIGVGHQGRLESSVSAVEWPHRKCPGILFNEDPAITVAIDLNR